VVKITLRVYNAHCVLTFSNIVANRFRFLAVLLQLARRVEGDIRVMLNGSIEMAYNNNRCVHGRHTTGVFTLHTRSSAASEKPRNVLYHFKKVRKVLWTRKAPACLLTLLYVYGKPRLCINIHQYAPPRTVLQQTQRRASCCSRPLQCTLRSIERI